MARKERRLTTFRGGALGDGALGSREKLTFELADQRAGLRPMSSLSPPHTISISMQVLNVLLSEEGTILWQWYTLHKSK